ncbi:hypothetical protein Q3G72_013164 [Acer saccharum]|nr:hypothetical protein Q3G72_013164 [Acer saccharum]
MSWTGDSEIELEDWLSCNAIGKLKDFTSVFQVNKNLEDKGLGFSSSYMGGKNVVWTFDSTYDRDGFINNEKVIPSDVQIKVGNSLLLIQLDVPPIEISNAWLSKKLGLKSSKFRERCEGDEFHQVSGDREWELVERCQVSFDSAEEKKKDHYGVREKAGSKAFLGQEIPWSGKVFDGKKVSAGKVSSPKVNFLNQK